MNNNWGGGHFLTLVAIYQHDEYERARALPLHDSANTRRISDTLTLGKGLISWSLGEVSQFDMLDPALDVSVTPCEDSVNIRQFALSRWPTRNIKKHCMGKRVKDVEKERKARNPLFNVRQSPVKLPALRLWSFVHLLVASGAVHLLKQRLISVSTAGTRS